MNAISARIAAAPPEIAFVLSCARARSSREAGEALLARSLDWGRLLEFSHRHGLSSLLYWRVRERFAHAVPAEILDRMKARFERRARRNLFLSAELISLTKLFEAHGVESLAWKGPTLAVGAYRNLALREFGDLDILVHEKDVEVASNLLRSRGFDGPSAFVGRREPAFLAMHDERAFVHREKCAMVELHWAITPKAFALRLDVGRLWERSVMVRLAGGTVRSLAPEELFLTLCVHGAKHRWERLSLVCDICEFLDTHDRLDWSGVRELARASGAERMLLLGILLAHELFGAKAPEPLLARARADGCALELADEVVTGYFPAATVDENALARRSGVSAGRGADNAEDALRLSGMFSFEWRAKENFGDRLRYLVNQFLPTYGDLSAVDLPDRLYFLYYAIRPFRLAAKYGGAIWTPAISRMFAAGSRGTAKNASGTDSISRPQ